MKALSNINPLWFVRLGALCFIAASTVGFAFANTDKANLQVLSLTLDITGFESQTGQVMIALFNSQDGFVSETPFKDRILAVTEASVTISFDNLPQGEYAFKLFHDANGNGELDTNDFGIPSEDYYFSNDASDPFSAPEWEEAVFNLNDSGVRKQITLN